VRYRNALPPSSIVSVLDDTRTHLTVSLALPGFSISAKQATMVMGVISVVVLMYLLSHIFWWTLFSSGFLISLHLLLRDASMHKDEEDKIDMTGDLDLDASEDAAFLNPAQVDQV
jgi:hypothetical protein